MSPARRPSMFFFARHVCGCWPAVSRFLAITVALLFAHAYSIHAANNTVPGLGELAIGQNTDGRLELFQVGADGQLRHRWQKEPSGDWSPWWSLGGTFSRGIAVASRMDGALEVFAVDTGSGALKSIRQMGPNGREWSSWRSLGGKVVAPVAVGRNAARRLEVFGVTPETYRVMHLWQTDLEDGWSSWVALEGTVAPGLVLARNQDGRLEVFGVEVASNTLVHAWQK